MVTPRAHRIRHTSDTDPARRSRATHRQTRPLCPGICLDLHPPLQGHTALSFAECLIRTFANRPPHGAPMQITLLKRARSRRGHASDPHDSGMHIGSLVQRWHRPARLLAVANSHQTRHKAPRQIGTVPDRHRAVPHPVPDRTRGLGSATLPTLKCAGGCHRHFAVHPYLHKRARAVLNLCGSSCARGMAPCVNHAARLGQWRYRKGARHRIITEYFGSDTGRG